MWIFSLETLTQVHYSDPTIFWNLKTKYLQKIFFLSISLLITFLQSLKVGSPSPLIFTIITQSHLLLIRYLNHPIELILMERIQSLNISSVICSVINFKILLQRWNSDRTLDSSRRYLENHLNDIEMVDSICNL